MNDNLTTNASNEAESPAFWVGAVMPSIKLIYCVIPSNEDRLAGQPIVLTYSPHFLNSDLLASQIQTNN